MLRMLGVALACAALVAAAGDASIRVGPWRAWLDSPGGELPFGLDVEKRDATWRAWLVNGPERIEIPKVSFVGGQIVLDVDHYDSIVRATPSADGARLDGEWKKRRGPDAYAKLPFHATAGTAARFPSDSTRADAKRVDGRWAVRFAPDDELAVAIFETQADRSLSGTFLTPTGDYRYLAGTQDGACIRLSCFDGAHAFLFDARVQSDGTITGDFWAGDSSHETWTARRDDNAALPDAFALTKWEGNASLEKLVFPDLDGKRRSLADSAFAGKARILQVMGSWCPNCQDETQYLVLLDRRYRSRGLSIVGLAFEVTGDFTRDAAQVRKLAARDGVTYPLLVAGTSDKAKASAAFPALDRVRAYPTTIFLHADGRVRAVHTGFAGPATGAANRALRAEFESIIEELLTESSSR
ncbi:MAG: TlpA family protein disulfide reductase [Planctomycetes bacterium]|nr:TlpA family protein disulfide reductase [Planctomycetota bacterium]